jgi:Protein of unknown function (DUF3102)
MRLITQRALRALEDSRPIDIKRGATAAEKLAQRAQAIRALGRRTIANIIEIGEHLTAARNLCDHGQWLPWLEREFGWSDRTALNFIRVHEMSKSENFSDLSVPVSVLYLLARPSTPEAARREVFDRAERGDPPSHAEVEAAIEEAKSGAKPRARLPASLDPRPPAYDDIISEIIDLFKQLDRQAQTRCVLKLRQILTGRT